MNIVVKTFDNHSIVRPDTTLERNNKDFFLPDFVSSLSYSPVLFAKICKPGKSISTKFAPRYYDGVNFGVLFYASNLIVGGPYDMADASCIDHSSFLAFPTFDPSELQYGRDFKLRIEGKEVFTYSGGNVQMIDLAIEELSRKVFLRTGDVVAIELETHIDLPGTNAEGLHFEGSWLDKEILNFSVR